MNKEEYDECIKHHKDGSMFKGLNYKYISKSPNHTLLKGVGLDGKIHKVILENKKIILEKYLQGAVCERKEIGQDKKFLEDLKAIYYQDSDKEYVDILHKSVPIQIWNNIKCIDYSLNCEKMDKI